MRTSALTLWRASAATTAAHEGEQVAEWERVTGVTRTTLRTPCLRVWGLAISGLESQIEIVQRQRERAAAGGAPVRAGARPNGGAGTERLALPAAAKPGAAFGLGFSKR